MLLNFFIKLSMKLINMLNSTLVNKSNKKKYIFYQVNINIKWYVYLIIKFLKYITVLKCYISRSTYR